MPHIPLGITQRVLRIFKRRARQARAEKRDCCQRRQRNETRRPVSDDRHNHISNGYNLNPDQDEKRDDGYDERGSRNQETLDGAAHVSEVHPIVALALIILLIDDPRADRPSDLLVGGLVDLNETIPHQAVESQRKNTDPEEGFEGESNNPEESENSTKSDSRFIIARALARAAGMARHG